MAAARGTPPSGDAVLAVVLLAGGAVGVLVCLGLLVSGRFTAENVLLVFLVPGVVLGAGWLVRHGLRARDQRSRPRALSGTGGSGGASRRSPS
ncbi:hypothetical protein ACI78S_00260 [Geodermatophilus sp. SYSU D00815]